MQFTTKVPIAAYHAPIDYQSNLVAVGSCFAENMAEKLAYFKFQHTVNPFGIIFNPVSIARLVDRAVRHEVFTEEDIFFHNDLWHCFEVHSELSHSNPTVFLENLNETLQTFQQQILKATHFIFTYGTAWVYRHKATQHVVANCHKVPQNQFDKEILSVEGIAQFIQDTIEVIRKVNPKAQFIFTVSPVRHIKDGFAENQRSKAHLIAAIHEILNSKSSFLNYFPSYEIMMDELRDYRFYAEDMLHPNQVAINYIWERFTEHYIAMDCRSIMQEINSIQKGLLHRSFNPETTSHQLFLQSLQEKISKLQEQFPTMKF